MDEDPLISSNNNEKHPRKEDVVGYDDDDGDNSSSEKYNTPTCQTQSSFLVPKINLGTPNKSSTCKDALGATVTYGLISSPGISRQDNQEIFVLDKHLLFGKKLNPMAKEFKPSLGQHLPQNDYSSIASRPSKMFPQTVKHSAPPPSADDRLLVHIASILQKDKLLIMMRGCPGSGKSSLADKIMHSLERSQVGIVLSTDNYFNMTGSPYRYDPSKLPLAHAWNKGQAFTAMNKNSDLIIIDNTNVTKWEMEPYVKMGHQNGYKVMLVEPNTNWKFNARKLAKKNIHDVSFQKIEDMLSRYEKNVTVKQMLNSKKTKEKNSYTERERKNIHDVSFQKIEDMLSRYEKNVTVKEMLDSKKTKEKNSYTERERNTAKTQMKVHPKRKKKADYSRDPNNNSNSGSCSVSPPEVIKTLASFANNNPREAFPVCPTACDICSDSGSWGSDDWYEPQAQRCPKDDIFSNSKHDFTDSGSSSADNFQEEVLDIWQSLNEEKPRIEDLTCLTLKCIKEFNNEEIFERASLAAVEGCQRKNEILLDCFQKNLSKKFLHQNPMYSANEDNLANLACSMDLPTESLRSSTSEDLIDTPPEEQNEFYLLLSLKSDFLHLLTQIFGPIDNLNTEEVDQERNVNLKLNYDDMKCLHDTLTQICALKKETDICKAKEKKNQAKKHPSFESSITTKFAKENVMTSSVSLSEIMKEQEESRCELEHKLQKTEYATAKKLNKLCSEFPGYDPSVIENIFKENDYNMHETLAILQGHPQRTAIDWRFDSNIASTPSANKNISWNTNRQTDLNWLKISEENEKELFEFYQQRLRDTINQRSVYLGGSYPMVAAYFQQQFDEFTKKMKTAKLNLLKQNLASSFTLDIYNKIDLHGMNKWETRFIVQECLNDYSKALKYTPSMKHHLLFVTGKGTNSKNKKPVLRPFIIAYLQKHNYQFVKGEGELKVFL